MEEPRVEKKYIADIQNQCRNNHFFFRLGSCGNGSYYVGV